MTVTSVIFRRKKVSAVDTTDYERDFKTESYTYLTMDGAGEPGMAPGYQHRCKQLFRRCGTEYDRRECDLSNLVFCNR